MRIRYGRGSRVFSVRLFCRRRQAIGLVRSDPFRDSIKIQPLFFGIRKELKLFE